MFKVAHGYVTSMLPLQDYCSLLANIAVMCDTRAVRQMRSVAGSQGDPPGMGVRKAWLHKPTTDMLRAWRP